jgi:hypothetical protein
MSAAAPITFIRPVISQTTIGNNRISLFSPGGRKLSLNDYKIDKTVPRLRRG